MYGKSSSTDISLYDHLYLELFGLDRFVLNSGGDAEGNGLYEHQCRVDERRCVPAVLVSANRTPIW
jgi:hypothetical protein